MVYSLYIKRLSIASSINLLFLLISLRSSRRNSINIYTIRNTYILSTIDICKTL